MKLRENYKYALVVPTSMGVRICPPDGQPVYASETFRMQVTSAETNVASISSYLGLPTHVLTAFVKDSPIAKMIKHNLLGRGMTFEGPEVEQGGRTLSVKDFDLERLFGEEGVGVLHLSGLIGALSPETSQFCLELARAAKKHGTLIAFDLNHRASFWKGREEELHNIFTEIASVADILVGNEEDFQLCLGIEGPEAGGKDLGSKIESFKAMINCVREKFPNASVFGTTLRQVINVNRHLWGAILWSDNEWHIAEPREITVLDRIGGGDGFVGGLLYSIIKGWDAERQLQFAWASGALATTFLTDYAQPADEEQIFSIWGGNARVKR